MEVYEKIKLLRLTKDWSQEEVALKLDMSLNGYGSIERGETDVNLSRLKQIAQLYGVELAALFDNGANIFNFNGNTQYGNCVHNQNYSVGAYSPEYLQLQSEFEKQRAINEQQAQEISYLRGLVETLLGKEKLTS